ncbi:MAG: nicotinate phosphoribosyltransferase [Pseudomonadota bacterium]
MSTLGALYRHSLSLLTDLYQLTMACGLWKAGLAEREAVFHLYFRNNPFGGGFAIAAGLQTVLEYLQLHAFADDDLAYLSTLTGADGRPLFEPGFLNFLQQTPLRCDVDGVEEGRLVFPTEPLLRVRGPLYQCQLLETPLLTLINFQTLIATKACRVCLATEGEPVLEFGLRRAHGVDGALAASRAAYLGGCEATSNVLAGKLFGIPTRGTHAHSWVMAFDDEREAFAAYADAMPGNGVFLVDTYDTVQGVRHAIEQGQRLRAQGQKLLGVRLDSGDLAQLSIVARQLLDEAGFADAAIVASNDLDEGLISSLKRQGARINVWGVGTKLVTAFDQPALGGVYKLGAIRRQDGAWQYKVKLSEQEVKVSTPGVQQVRRYRGQGGYLADLILDQDCRDPRQGVLTDPTLASRNLELPADASWQELLVPVLRQGQVVYTPPPLSRSRQLVHEELAWLSPGSKRFDNPARYPVALERSLHELKMRLIDEARQAQRSPQGGR